MDVDAVEPTRNSPFINFFDVSHHFPWQEPRPEQIRLRRAAMYDGLLLFDVLLTAGGINEPYLYYPPQGVESLQKLLDVIERSTYDILKKDCLIYFLLKWHQDGREGKFQQQRCIPPQFAALADAYWYIDTGIDLLKAVALLSDARLNRDYASKIIQALSIAPDGPALVRRYVRTAKPLLVEPLDIEYYALSLADSSMLEAWQFSRTFNESDEMRSRLFEVILEWTVIPHPRPVALSQLLALPLSPFEETVFNKFVEAPPKTLEFSAVAILQDLICVRLVQGGRYSEAIKLDRQFTSKTLPKDLQATKARSKMVHDIYTALPSIERSLIDSELDPMIPQKSPLIPKPTSPARKQAPAALEPENMTLSQSWEEVRMPEALVNKSTPLKDVRIPTATPRFGGPALQASKSSPIPAPIIPINFNGAVSGNSSTPKRNLPLSASVIGATKQRTSMSGVGSRMAFGNGVISSPASGIKVPAGIPSSSHEPGHAFVSAGRQQNAFYQPPKAKVNGVKRAFVEDETNHSPERVDTSGRAMDVEMESEKEDAHMASVNDRVGRRGRNKKGIREEATDDENVLQYSVFRTSKEPSPPPKTQMSKVTHKKKAPPGSFLSDEEDAMEQDQDDHSTRKTSRTRKLAKSNKEPAASSKPPAKKVRQTKEKDLSRSIPGALMDDDDHEEEDEVPPLPSPRRGARKARASASVEPMDESEGMQTRRRSSRLTTGGSNYGGSTHGGSPEPQPAPKATRKTARTTGATKKKR